MLAACATSPSASYKNIKPLWLAREAKLKQIKTWKIQGRIVMTTEDEGWQFNIRWQRRPKTQQIDITGPLGNSHVRIIEDKYGARLIDENRNEHNAATMQELVANVTGWQLPLENLYYWVRGLPVPQEKGKREWDSIGRLTRIQQTGWDVKFDHYTRAGDLEFPDRLFLHNAALAREGELPEVEVRFAISRWSLTLP